MGLKEDIVATAVGILEGAPGGLTGEALARQVDRVHLSGGIKRHCFAQTRCRPVHARPPSGRCERGLR
jgi:hypothetical protein